MRSLVVEVKHLLQLLDVRGEIEVGEDYAFGVPGGTAGENDRGGVVQLGSLADAEKEFEEASGEKFCGEQSD